MADRTTTARFWWGAWAEPAKPAEPAESTPRGGPGRWGAGGAGEGGEAGEDHAARVAGAVGCGRAGSGARWPGGLRAALCRGGDVLLAVGSLARRGGARVRRDAGAVGGWFRSGVGDRRRRR